MSYNPCVKQIENNIVISGVKHFDLRQTFDCGQAFRWNEYEDGTWGAIVGKKRRKVGVKDGEIIIYNADINEYESFWREYLDIDRDYGKIIEKLSENDVLKNAAAENKGIRILRQDKWETLCSFIISQNNNIPRIKGIVERLCENFGEETEEGFTFPDAEKIAALEPEDLSIIRAGFRARYIIDGARKYVSNGIDHNIIEKADIDTARNELMKIKGVGVKVADCTLLFGYNRIDALPKDVWIKRAIEQFFDGKFPSCAKGYEGIAQQYLFNYIRNL